VKINIHEQLYEWRQEITKAQPDRAKSLAMKIANGVFAVPFAYSLSGNMMRGALKILPDSITYSGLNTWGKQRDLPELPKESFKDWYKKNRK
jgi:L-lactate dehydrogenase complex protein LldF